MCLPRTAMPVLVERENVSRWFAIPPQSQADCAAIDPRFHINRRFDVSRCVTADSDHAGNASDRPLPWVYYQDWTDGISPSGGTSCLELDCSPCSRKAVQISSAVQSHPSRLRQCLTKIKSVRQSILPQPHETLAMMQVDSRTGVYIFSRSRRAYWAAELLPLRIRERRETFGLERSTQRCPITILAVCLFICYISSYSISPQPLHIDWRSLRSHL